MLELPTAGLPNRSPSSGIPPLKRNESVFSETLPYCPGEFLLPTNCLTVSPQPTEFCWVKPKLSLLARVLLGWPWASQWNSKSRRVPRAVEGQQGPSWRNRLWGWRAEQAKGTEGGTVPCVLAWGKPVSSTICWDLKGSSPASSPALGD